MPNPFSKKPASQTRPATVETLQVTNSVLVCEVCFKETPEGEYTPATKRLTFTCPEGHENMVRNVEL